LLSAGSCGAQRFKIAGKIERLALSAPAVVTMTAVTAVTAVMT
jgi:hypothetical protein